MQNKELKEQVEKIFKGSNSSDELFDAFRTAIDHKIKDIDMYSILLWNKTLSIDEISMYAEKVCKEFPEFASDIYIDVAEVLDSRSVYGKNKEKSFYYLKKAAESEPNSFEPYVLVDKIYNPELNIPGFNSVIDFIEGGLASVREKSRLYFILAKMYAKKGEIEKGKVFQSKGEEALKKGY